jgi:hypothetical protein
MALSSQELEPPSNPGRFRLHSQRKQYNNAMDKHIPRWRPNDAQLLWIDEAGMPRRLWHPSNKRHKRQEKQF